MPMVYKRLWLELVGIVAFLMLAAGPRLPLLVRLPDQRRGLAFEQPLADPRQELLVLVPPPLPRSVG